MSDPFAPDPVLLALLGSAIVHADEALGPNGHPADIEAFRSALSHPDVQRWLEEMGGLAMLPVKR